MDRRWVGLDGLEVVGAVRAGRQVLRVRRNGWVIADCTSVAEVARHVDLADLCEVIELPAQRRAEPAAGRLQGAGTSSHHR
ncbi:transposase [Nonomuraea sp. NPDC050404]|uniref:transposase n=1 Tax=Nonomuraea sp. NPDC050404 TaxID=3155783 RepID=UPI0033F9400B